jgi:hypothetical protein
LCIPKSPRAIPRAQDDAAAVEIIPFSEIPSLNLAFDHMEIIKDSGILL